MGMFSSSCIVNLRQESSLVKQYKIVKKLQLDIIVGQCMHCT